MAKNEFTRGINQKYKTLIALTLIAVGFFILGVFGVTSFLETPLQKIFLPAQIALNKSGRDFTNFVTTIGDIKSLREKETKTTYENALLEAENASLKKLEEENKVLRAQLGAPKINPKLIVAQVIGGDPLLSSSKLLVDKGKRASVRKGDLVILKDILIGEVISVGDSTSTIRLLNDSETKIPAETEKGVGGILRGEFGNRIILEKVVQGKKIKKGEIVFSSGEADMPKGLVLGKISKIEAQPASIFQKAVVVPLISYESLETVFIIESAK
ncbi:MAG: hypothetical protein A2Z11_01235 [Candidatus Woykebacteria bacterium RBG_16_43_9]|uniref:Cell shape-determining protein MreC n=1 Tax=Candidatus Woykebacteria bacterium RBG_16_43_9 TaxID=1802596 RepID=A0A1G1WG21_9BACT|nr:MAG: hypothetical protein A2Z11_01235 [Candidatus Woykebacteria bacterium RBG_16_43_9]